MQERIIPKEVREAMEANSTASKDSPKNLMDALDRIVDYIHCHSFGTTMMKKLDKELTYVSERQNISKMQAFFLAILFDEGQFMTTKDIAKELSCTNIKVMSYKSELDDLVSQAAITYFLMNFGQPDNYDRLKASYDEQKAQLSTKTGYTTWTEATLSN